MMLSVLMIARKLAPFILLALVFGGVWWNGYNTGHKHGEQQIERLKSESEAIIAQSNIENQHAQQTLIESAKIIDNAHESHQKQINEIAANNAAILADRVRRERVNCGKDIDNVNAESAEVGANESNADGVFLERAGTRLIERHRLADEINESLRSCQDYLKTVQSTINQLSNNDQSN